MGEARQDLLEIFAAALEAVRGDRVVAQALQQARLTGDWHVVAIGKAAAAMWQGAREVLGGQIRASLVITKHGHAEALSPQEGLELIESDHPVPGAASLEAGRRLLDFLKRAPADARFLFLVSGGASSLVEVLPEGMTAGQLAQLNTWLLGSGLDIAAMNAVRKRVSRIKGGGLLRWVGTREGRCLLISDVPGDDPAVIGSGLLVPGDAPLPDGLPDWVGALIEADAALPSSSTRCEVIANRTRALEAAAETARQLGYRVELAPDLLSGDAGATGAALGARLRDAAPGVYLWGGETTVRLPPQPGRGGRNQHLALGAARALAGAAGAYLLAAGTDGTDGPTDDAGALVDGQTTERMALDGIDARDALVRADAGTALEAAGDLVRTGPTGTNVMDLVIGLKT
jgi:hydroxypyruvate reductase